MHQQQESFTSKTSKQIEECIKEMQNNIDSSFNRIDTFIDQTLNDIDELFKQRQLQQQQSTDCQQYNRLPQLQSPDIQNQQFNNQLIHQVTSLIKISFDKQVNNKEECLNQQFKKQLTQILEKEKIEQQSLQETIKSKDKLLESQNLQIQQFKQTQISIQQPIINQPSSQLIFKPFNYQLLQNNSIQQHQECQAIAINKDCSIVIAGCDKQIKVFEFKQEVLKQTQLLSEHQDSIITLKFMSKSNQFISGSDDKSIIIWSMNQSNSWIIQQKLNGHNNSIYSLILNNNEDLIISGSADKTIKFWMKQNHQWLCQQTITDHNGSIQGLSINQQQNKVISCGSDNQILIIEQSQQKWIVIQKIKGEKYGFRICFINDNVFTFQPNGIKQMHVYEMNNTNKQYLKTKDILVKGCGDDYFVFPQQHIKSKCLLVNKNGEYVNLIRTMENGEFKTEQSIEFEHYNLYGCMSEDGQYLMTWDHSTKEIQIRKYNEI
ncbi:unnamed protein product [Paramecium primaurelia]|uniref:WD40-repeat-containing domain n=1 Tax=Paramecium primaurelia TaxID=5886 RepID=A0A8S1QMR1_PARPR|nr:unnamed protein product [Paramecium primaurelia]